MNEISASLVKRIRRTEYFESDKALEISQSQDYVAASVASGRGRAWDEPRSGEIREVRLYKTGQISTRATLPRDGMGPILDREVLPKQFAEMLRLTGALGIRRGGRVIVAGGVRASSSLSVDTFDPYRSRTCAQLLGLGRTGGICRTEPDESVSVAALEAGADEVGRDLSRALFGQLSA
jgi:hypothetical protein